jgi:hypothetical protein
MKYPNIWSFIQLVQSEHACFEHITIQLDAGVSGRNNQQKQKLFKHDLILCTIDFQKGTLIRFIIVIVFGVFHEDPHYDSIVNSPHRLKRLSRSVEKK